MFERFSLPMHWIGSGHEDSLVVGESVLWLTSSQSSLGGDSIATNSGVGLQIPLSLLHNVCLLAAKAYTVLSVAAECKPCRQDLNSVKKNLEQVDKPDNNLVPYGDLGRDPNIKVSC